MARRKAIEPLPEGGEDEGKRYALHLRTTHKVRKHVGDEAVKTGRSVAQEVERRLEASVDFLPLLDMLGAMETDKAALQLFRTLNQVLKSIRVRAGDKGWSEIQTRQALKSAFDYVAGVSFYTGGDLPGPPDGYRVHGSAPAERSPEAVGFWAAADRMIWMSALDESVLMDDLAEEKITDHWSGDGSVTIGAPNPPVEPPPARSLEEIMADRPGGSRQSSRKTRPGGSGGVKQD